MDYYEDVGFDAKVLLNEKIRRVSGKDFLSFMQYCWWMPKPLKIGRHTRAISDRLTRAVEDFRHGKSTYLLVNVPFRHGKSDMVSRAFPAYFLGRCSDLQPDIISSGYGASLAEDFTKATKSIINSDKYKDVFPGVELDPKRNSVESWGIKGSVGTVTVVGLGGAITGKGGHLIILDDYCKNREEAYQATTREKLWQSFSVDLMSRQNAPAAIVLVVATPWHIDDITGRIRYAMAHDPEFPRFEELIFPAHKEGPDGWDILFPELYDADWYKHQRATLGSVMSAALLDCHPVADGGQMFKGEWLQTYERKPDHSKMYRYILIDSANSKRKDRDSDYTVMSVWGYGADRNFYLLDCIRDRLDLSGRTEAIFSLVEMWQPKNVFWEQCGAMSDVQHVRLEMDERGFHFRITEIPQSVAKADRIAWLIPAFERGQIWLPRNLKQISDEGGMYDVVQDFVTDEYSTYPSARHDDILDCFANLFHPYVTAIAQFPPVETAQMALNGKTRFTTTGRKWRPF